MTNDPHESAMRQENIALHKTVAALQADNARLLALNGTASTQHWKALKSIDRGSYCYEAVRLWAVGNLIIAEKRRGRWFVQVASMAKRLSELAVSNT